jgi:hypothetical protein
MFDILFEIKVSNIFRKKVSDLFSKKIWFGWTIKICVSLTKNKR